MQCLLKNHVAQPATIGPEFRDWLGGSRPGDRCPTGPCIRFNPDGAVQADGGPNQAGRITVGR